MEIACLLQTACCPICGEVSERIHGSYIRTITDLPSAGRSIILKFKVRKFVCGTASCPCKIFTERHDNFVHSYARQTVRLGALIEAIGLAGGGELGSRLARRMGIDLSSSTLLRRLMALPEPATSSVRVLGVDDFAWKKRFRYGTILVDLENRKIVDVLLDRSEISFEQWLASHPGVEVICRNRETDYIKAATRASPHALQVADRWHLVRNLAEALTTVLSRCQKERHEALTEAAYSPPQEAVPRLLPVPSEWQQQTPEEVEQRHQARQAQRDERFRQMQALREQGLT